VCSKIPPIKLSNAPLGSRPKIKKMVVSSQSRRADKWQVSFGQSEEKPAAGRPWPRAAPDGARHLAACSGTPAWSMIPKSEYRFSDKIMLKQ
jgi:hypothetical protein